MRLLACFFVGKLNSMALRESTLSQGEQKALWAVRDQSSISGICRCPFVQQIFLQVLSCDKISLRDNSVRRGEDMSVVFAALSHTAMRRFAPG